MDILNIAVGTSIGFVVGQMAVAYTAALSIKKKRSRHLRKLEAFEQQLNAIGMSANMPANAAPTVTREVSPDVSVTSQVRGE